MQSRLLLALFGMAAAAFLSFCLWALSLAMNANVALVQTQRVPPPTSGDGAFVEAWSVRLNRPLVHEMALNPVSKGEFFALGKDEIFKFNANGERLAKFAAPAMSSRIVTDPTGAMPHLLIVSSSTKWTGAIDYVVTTDHFLDALDVNGREVWRRRFDPKDVSVLEPMVTRLNQSPVIVLSASERVICFDASGRELWNLRLWHHPGTLAEGSENSSAALLAAVAPKGDIVGIGSDGRVAGPWGKGDGPRRFRTMRTASGLYGISLRQVFGSGNGVRRSLAFFDSHGTVRREVELAPDAQLSTYSPIAAMDVDGSGRRNWVILSADGTILVFSPTGAEIARYSTGLRTRTFLSVPQPYGPDLLITATHSGLTAWQPVAGHIRPPG